MSNNQVVINTLIKKREQLEAELAAATEKISAEIHEIDNAIQIMTGKRASELQSVARYDDENPDYIRGNEDGV
jgi:hypothetical protein